MRSGKGNNGFLNPAFCELGNGRVSLDNNRLSTGSWSNGIGYVYHSTGGVARSHPPVLLSVQIMRTHGSLAFLAHISVHGRHIGISLHIQGTNHIATFHYYSMITMISRAQTYHVFIFCMTNYRELG